MKILSSLIITFGTLLALWVIGFVWFAGSVIVNKNPSVTKADAIIVVTGGGGRVNTALDLLSKGKGESLFISGVHTKTKIEEILDLWEGDKDAVREKIYLGRRAHDTEGNASESQNWITQENIHDIILVTSDYHMLRTWVAFQGTLKNVRIQNYPVHTPNLRYTSKEFWILCLGEYNKTILTWLKIHVFSKRATDA